MCECVNVCVCEREREWVSKWVSRCVCVCVREREWVMVGCGERVRVGERSGHETQAHSLTHSLTHTRTHSHTHKHPPTHTGDRGFDWCARKLQTDHAGAGVTWQTQEQKDSQQGINQNVRIHGMIKSHWKVRDMVSVMQSCSKSSNVTLGSDEALISL